MIWLEQNTQKKYYQKLFYLKKKSINYNKFCEKQVWILLNQKNNSSVERRRLLGRLAECKGRMINLQQFMKKFLQNFNSTIEKCQILISGSADRTIKDNVQELKRIKKELEEAAGFLRSNSIINFIIHWIKSTTFKILKCISSFLQLSGCFTDQFQQLLQQEYQTNQRIMKLKANKEKKELKIYQLESLKTLNIKQILNFKDVKLPKFQKYLQDKLNAIQ